MYTVLENQTANKYTKNEIAESDYGMFLAEITISQDGIPVEREYKKYYVYKNINYACQNKSEYQYVESDGTVTIDSMISCDADAKANLTYQWFGSNMDEGDETIGELTDETGETLILTDLLRRRYESFYCVIGSKDVNVKDDVTKHYSAETINSTYTGCKSYRSTHSAYNTRANLTASGNGTKSKHCFCEGRQKEDDDFSEKEYQG